MREAIWTVAFLILAVLGFVNSEEAARLSGLPETAARRWPIHTVGLRNGLYLYFAFLISRRYLSTLELAVSDEARLVPIRYVLVPLMCFLVVMYIDGRISITYLMGGNVLPLLLVCWLMLGQSSAFFSDFVMVKKWVIEKSLPAEEVKSQLLMWHIGMALFFLVIPFAAWQ